MKHNNKPKGSILIWTVLLGVTLTTVFFFFSQRLNLNSALQRKSLEISAQKEFIKSYANYLESLDQATLLAMPKQIEFEGITGSLSNEISEIKGMTDVNDTLVFNVTNGQAQVEFNFCGKQEKGRALEITNTESLTIDECGNAAYDGLAVTKANSNFELSSGNAPVSYRITPFDETAILESKKWRLELDLEQSGENPIRIYREFKTKS